MSVTIICYNNTIYPNTNGKVGIQSIKVNKELKILSIEVQLLIHFQYESQYVMKEDYSAKSLRDFIYNFTRKNLKRTLRSHVEDAKNTHFFGSTGNTQVDDGNATTVHITDLTTRTFKKFVKTPGTVS